MEALIVILLLALTGAVIYLVRQNFIGGVKPDDSSQKLMLEVIENLRKSVEEGGSKSRAEIDKRFVKMNEQLTQQQHRSIETMQKQFGQSAKIIKEVTQKLTKLDETNKQVVGFAEQMKSLENILKNPKQRGILGEYFLEALLGNVLAPGQYKMQYKFKDGEIVDAAIFFRDKIIPVDAKFSLEKYNLIMQTTDKTVRDKLEREFKQDLKNRIDETAKYIRPSEGTTEFSFMFIPAEGVYYNLLVYNVGTVEMNTQDLVEYAFRKHVIIVSPTSFFAYLETVLQGLKALKMEKNVKEIIDKIGKLGRHLNSYETYMTKLGNNLGTTVNMYNSAAKEYRKIDKDVYKITDGSDGGKLEEAVSIDKPSEEMV